MAASDETLVIGALNGDRSAFVELYRRRSPLIHAMCFDVARDHDTAADLAQDVFLRAYERLDTLRDPRRFVSWLAGVARQVCREWRRNRRRHRLRFTTLEHDPPAPPPKAVDDRLALLNRMLSKLPQQQRLTLHAYYLQGLSVEEARTVLGLSRSGFFRILARARERLREAISKREARS